MCHHSLWLQENLGKITEVVAQKVEFSYLKTLLFKNVWKLYRSYYEAEIGNGGMRRQLVLWQEESYWKWHEELWRRNAHSRKLVESWPYLIWHCNDTILAFSLSLSLYFVLFLTPGNLWNFLNSLEKGHWQKDCWSALNYLEHRQGDIKLWSFIKIVVSG